LKYFFRLIYKFFHWKHPLNLIIMIIRIIINRKLQDLIKNPFWNKLIFRKLVNLKYESENDWVCFVWN
jgi:hypothetical protein